MSIWTRVTARVEGIDRQHPPYETRFLVDTGALNCLAPAAALKDAGVLERGRRKYEMANGEVVELPYGHAWITFMDEEVLTEIVFGPDNAEPLLGVLALVDAGFVVDPDTHTLRRLRTRRLKVAAAA